MIVFAGVQFGMHFRGRAPLNYNSHSHPPSSPPTTTPTHCNPPVTPTRSQHTQTRHAPSPPPRPPLHPVVWCAAANICSVPSLPGLNRRIDKHIYHKATDSRWGMWGDTGRATSEASRQCFSKRQWHWMKTLKIVKQTVDIHELLTKSGKF